MNGHPRISDLYCHHTIFGRKLDSVSDSIRFQMILVSNIALPKDWVASSGEQGESILARDVSEFLSYRGQPDTLWVVNCDPQLTLKLAAASILPSANKALISVDLVLRRPHGIAGKVGLIFKRLLFDRVDHFIHHFTDLRGYQELFGIGPERSSFVPFKANIRHRYKTEASIEGEYVLCFGRSMRDFDTFFNAVEGLPYPAAIAKPDVLQLRAHGSRFTRPIDQLPANVRILDDDGTPEAQIRMLSEAKIVVLPVLKRSMLASISVSLNAMLLGKCVIGSEGPGMSDIFSGKALFVPAEDPLALAEMIRRAWDDDALRRSTANAGREYALGLGGEPELFQRIIDQAVLWYRGQSPQQSASCVPSL